MTLWAPFRYFPIMKLCLIGKPVEEVESQDLLDAKKIVNNLNAQNALHDASELVSGEKKNALFYSMVDITHQTPIVRNPEVNSLFDEMFDIRRELAKARYKGDEEMLQASLKHEFRKRTSMMSPMKYNRGVYEVKSKVDLQDEKMQVINFLLKKYKHEQDMSINPDGNIVLNGYKFQDAKAQSLYEEIKKVYATLEMQRENCAIYEKTRKNMTQNIIDKMADYSVNM